MYALVDNIEAYPRFLPWCRDAQVQREKGQTTATLTVGVRGIRQSFTTRNDNRPQQAIDMQLVQGPFRHFSASWRFTPLAQGCRIEFSMDYEMASRTLAKLLAPLFDQIADTMVDAFTRRAEEIYGRPES
jgi:ribosome-associated toxin RatA of RatAB toxin-antitoxin module